jgi:hypothetical protein
VYWAIGVVDCCVYAIESKLLSQDGRPDIQAALQGAYKLLEKAGGNLTDVLDDEMPSDREES